LAASIAARRTGLAFQQHVDGVEKLLATIVGQFALMLEPGLVQAGDGRDAGGVLRQRGLIGDPLAVDRRHGDHPHVLGVEVHECGTECALRRGGNHATQALRSSIDFSCARSARSTTNGEGAFRVACDKHWDSHMTYGGGPSGAEADTTTIRCRGDLASFE
jgi:hypothetical protein